jgi:hypothetical protein
MRPLRNLHEAAPGKYTLAKYSFVSIYGVTPGMPSCWLYCVAMSAQASFSLQKETEPSIRVILIGFLRQLCIADPLSKCLHLPEERAVGKERAPRRNPLRHLATACHD